VALMVGSIIGYVICVVVYFNPIVGGQIFNVCMLSSFLGYISQCVGFIAMQTKFQNIKREFHSPFGIFGAVYAMLVFSLCVLSVVAFQTDQYALICIVSLQIVLAMYYFGYAKFRQTFSPEESKIMFVAHVITHNQAGHKLRKKKSRSYVYSGSKIVPSSTNGSKINRGDSGLGLSRVMSSAIVNENETTGRKQVRVMSKSDINNGENMTTKHIVPVPVRQAPKNNS